MVAVLQNIRSLHNVGSMFRTADAVGIEKLYLCGITPAPVDRFGKVQTPLAKVALGAEKTVAWEKSASVSKTLNKLKKDGYKIYAVELSKKSVPYYKVKVKRSDKVALMVGNEVKGLTPALLKKADKIIEIPMVGIKESLNVSVAFGIVAYGLIYG